MKDQPKQLRLLLVEDDIDFADSLSLLLSLINFSVCIKETLQEGRRALASERFDVILLDLSLPDAEGPEAITALLSLQPECPLLVLTGQNNTSMAVRSLRAGARDYLTKPISRENLEAALFGALENAQSNQPTNIEPHWRGSPSLPVGDSPIWQRTLEMLHAAARSPKTTVLLTGESGVGKEVAASLLHQASARRNKPFVSFNAACFAPALLESEFFGHEAGAFTGATRAKKGLLELAEGGTLFLDEIGELQMDLQAKLLRVLDGHPYRRLGGERELTPDVRLICATNRSLVRAVSEGRFRLDLYHRLRVIEITIPPLRERGRDIERLALHFLAKLGAEMGIGRATLSAETLSLLSTYPWPGNVRELRNVIERALVLSQNAEIKPHHLPTEFHQAPPQSPSTKQPKGGSDPLDEIIRIHILRVYESNNQNLTHTAQSLGISRLTLRKRLQSYGIKSPNLLTEPDPQDLEPRKGIS
jgi:DNA-binding NtrC family response regulator